MNLRAGVLAGLLGVVFASAPVSVAAPASAPSRWVPHPGTTFQWQLSGKVDTSVKAKVYDVDGFDTSRSTVRTLHRKHRHVVCYISAGSWERWRPDADGFPKRDIGKPLQGWPGEWWLDIRRLADLRPILSKRMDMCAHKGFDAVEADNVDGYTNDTGFPLTAADQRRFNRWLARAAHARGLSIGLKNDLDQIPRLVHAFDFALDEECLVYHECAKLRPFVRAHKVVFHVEYAGEWPNDKSCAVAGFTSIRKHLNLGAWRRAC